MTSVCDVALAALAAGLCAWPPKEDGSKAPETERVPRKHLVRLFGEEETRRMVGDAKAVHTWIHRQRERPTREDLENLYRNGRSGFGLMCGAVSGKLEMFEAEDIRVYEQLRALGVEAGIGDLFERLERGYSEQTPGGGIHLYYRCDEIAGNTKPARRPKRPEEMRAPHDKLAVIFETRGQGGYSVVSPSNGQVHPSGKPYVLLRWSASTNYAGSGLFYCWSTSTEFESERGYSKFAVYTILNHGIDGFSAAAAELRKKGYGNQGTEGDTGADGAPAGDEAPDWPEPDEIWGPPPAPELPLELLPNEVADVAADVAERLQCPPDFVAFPLLVCEAGLIGRDAGIRPLGYDDWTERPCLWVALIGPPSTMKSPALDAGLRPLRRQQERDAKEFAIKHAVWEAACSEKTAAKRGEKPELPEEPIMTRRLTSDATVEKLSDLMAPSPGMTLERDELSGLFADMNKYHKGAGDDRQFYLQAYSGGPYGVDRISRGTVWVPDLYLNVVGGVQPKIARTVFGEGRRTAWMPASPASGRTCRRTGSGSTAGPTRRSAMPSTRSATRS